MFQKDYIMRLISEVIRALLKLFFNIDTNKKEDLLFNDEVLDEKYLELQDLIDNGKINEAENKLLEELNSKDISHYKLALMFYSYLNEKDINFLVDHDFSKDEIIDGLKHVSAVFGYGDMANALISAFLD
ncbi:MAG: hypothetical protein K0S61_4381 [Anaerocolumna sp.]|jgi:hypothetical protein|nr:hypothetical protein [Anaerocolumna sp.]